METGIIYKYTNINNNKVYIGQTNRPIQRRAEHRYHSRIDDKNNHFYNAIKKYGWVAFRYEVLEVIVEDTIDKLHQRLDEAEIYWIKVYDATNKDNGYNSSLGGNSRGCTSKEADLCYQDGTVIKTFASCKDIAKEFNSTESNVRGCLRGNQLFLKKYILTYHNIPKKWERVKSKHIYYQWSLDGQLIKKWDSVCLIEKELGFCTSAIVKCCLHPEKYKSFKGFKWSRELKQ